MVNDARSRRNAACETAPSMRGARPSARALRCACLVSAATLWAAAAAAQDMDCADFSSQASAQRFFLSAGGPERDPHRLDADRDGIACEWNRGPFDRTGARRPRSASALLGAASAGRTCHVGPRGGTYTLTASGRKNYRGC